MRKAVVKKEVDNSPTKPVSSIEEVLSEAKNKITMFHVEHAVPDEVDQQVLYWNPKVEKYGVTYAKILRAQLLQMQDTEFVRDKVPEMPDYLSYFATRWKYLEKM